MVKKFGIAFLAILTAASLMAANNISNVGYLKKFLLDQSIGVVATVIAVNVATVTFLLGNLMTMERSAKKELFGNTKTELKHNLIFMFCMFFAQVILVTIAAKKYSGKVFGYDTNQVLTFVALLCVVLVFFALIEIIIAIFRVADFLKNN